MSSTGKVRKTGMTRSWLAALMAVGLGCASSSTTGAGEAGDQHRACRVRLGPRAVPAARDPSAASTRAAAPSQIVVHVEAPLAPLARQLEQRVPKQLTDGRVGIGLGGSVSYSVQRGPLSLSTTATSLVIETPVQARAQACRGANCYASCEPQAVVRAELPLTLRPDYRFAPAVVSLRFTRGCKVRGLGGFLTIDLTPTLEAQLESELTKVGREIDRHLPDSRAAAEELWRELLAPRELPFGACVVLQPNELVQGPLVPSREQLRARFAVVATPELRSSCGAGTKAAPPLPPLRVDSALPAQGLVQLGMVTPLASLAPTAAARADVTAWGSDVDVAVTLAGEVCGELAFSARPSFGGDGQFIGLAQPQLSASDRARLLEQDVDLAALLRELSASSRVTPLLSVQGFRDATPALASAQSQPQLEISATVSATRAAGAAARGAELVAWLEAQGSVMLRPQILP